MWMTFSINFIGCQSSQQRENHQKNIGNEWCQLCSKEMVTWRNQKDEILILGRLVFSTILQLVAWSRPLWDLLLLTDRFIVNSLKFSLEYAVSQRDDLHFFSWVGGERDGGEVKGLSLCLSRCCCQSGCCQILAYFNCYIFQMIFRFSPERNRHGHLKDTIIFMPFC